MFLNSYRSKAGMFIVSLVLLLVFSSLAAVNSELMKRKISLDAEDASISSLLATVAKMSGCNIVLSAEVGGTQTNNLTDKQENKEKKITVHLKDVPVEQALSLIVKSVGLSYRFVGENTFLVGDKAKINEEVGERSYIINLNYVDASKLVKSFDVLPGKTKAIEGQNALLIQANPETYAEISKRIEELDTPQKQIEIRARLIEVSITDSKKFGIDWSRLNHLTTILAEDPVNADGVGLPYNYTDVTGALTHGNASKYELLPETQYFQKLDGWDNVGHFSRQLTAFDVTVDWLLENNAAKLLTDTRLTAMNGEEAEIFIGEVVPFVVIDNDKEVQVEREQTGIKLKVKPSINKDGQITAKIEPEVSSVTDLVGGYVPRTKQRKVTSTVTVPDGSKIIVGGLLSTTIVTNTNKLPFLGDLPFIGKLFQHKYEKIDTTDLIIEITPRVIDIANEQYELKIDNRLEKELIEKKAETKE